MKRLISWLLALTMIMSLPLSALAVEIDDSNPDVDVDFGELVEPEVGSEENPFVPEWVWNEAYTEATATTCEIKAGATCYISITMGGMELFVNGVSYGTTTGSRWMPQILTITNDTDAAATYELKVAYAVGSMENPATLVLGENVATVAAGTQGYYYTYTAEKEGTLVLEIATDAAGWTYVVNNLTTYAYGDTQWSNSDPVVNPAEVEVAAGDELQIMVNTYNPADEWNAPAGTVTVNASYKAEGPIEAADLVFYRYALSFQEYTGLQFIVKNSVISGYERVYAHVSQNAPEGVVESDMDYTTKGNYSYFNKDILSWSMTEEVTITLYGEKEGKLYVGQSVTTSVMEQALLKVPSATAAQKTVLIDMLNYGAAVQTSFNHNPENLPNADVEKLGYAQYATQTQPTLSAEISAEGTGSVAKYRDSLSLQSKVELQVIFKLTSFANKDVTQYKAEVTMGGNTTTIEGKDFRPSGSSYSIVPVVFAPYMLRETCTVVIKDLAGNVVSPVYTYSVEGLAKAKLNGTSADDVIYAMMKFGDAVSALM